MPILHHQWSDTARDNSSQSATADAGVKQRRREQWDKAIADVKQELDSSSPALLEEERLEAIEARIRSRKRKDNSIRNGSGQPASEDGFTPFSAVDGQDEVESLFNGSPQAQWPISTAPVPNLWNLAPESAYARDIYRAKRQVLDRRWTTKKLRMTELSVDKMVIRLVLHMDRLGWRSKAARAVPHEFYPFIQSPVGRLQDLLDECNAQLRQLQAKQDSWDEEIPAVDRTHMRAAYCQDENGYFHRTAGELNEALKRLFDRRLSGELTAPQMIGKTCYNLLISSAPPNLDCFNTLLTGLSKTRDDGVMWWVIGCMREAHVRMNEISMATILQYYTATDNAQQFTRFVEMMRGHHNGISLARPDINITQAGSSRLIRTESGKIIQKPHASPVVFGALVQGVLHFSGFEAAIQICKDMGSEGWGLTMGGLTPLLAECAKEGDWESGNAVWKQIKLIQSRSPQSQRNIYAKTYAAMLRLCAACERQDVFNDIYKEAITYANGHKKILYHLQHHANVVRRIDDRRRKAPLIQCDRPNVFPETPGVVESFTPFASPPEESVVRSPEPIIASHQDASTSQPSAQVSEIMEQRRAPTQRQPATVLREHLHGDLAATHELDEYEAGERPMSMVM
ncbi:hypothetical protein H2203_003011 [Taxawa tesnikishii (nom. ined.)]|nr:hypothetical protein H2203_003011 [Dothideales sp. JES 119]